MNTTRLFLAATLCVALALPAAVRAAEQNEQSVLLDTLRANRKAFVAVNLQLDEAQAKDFWPLYDKYVGELNPIQDRVVKLVEDYTADYKTLADDKALHLIQDYLSAEADRVQVRRTYLPEFAKILPGRTVARFYQLENKMDAVLRYELAGSIPVIDEKAAPPAKK